jgi:hypothetical protein
MYKMTEWAKKDFQEYKRMIEKSSTNILDNDISPEDNDKGEVDDDIE